MPVHACQENGKKGWQWGGHGKCYTYESESGSAAAHAKATAQGQAAHAHGYTGASGSTNPNEEEPGEELDPDDEEDYALHNKLYISFDHLSKSLEELKKNLLR